MCVLADASCLHCLSRLSGGIAGACMGNTRQVAMNTACGQGEKDIHASLQCCRLSAFCQLAVENPLDDATTRIAKMNWMSWLAGYTRTCVRCKVCCRLMISY